MNIDSDQLTFGRDPPRANDNREMSHALSRVAGVLDSHTEVARRCGEAVWRRAQQSWAERAAILSGDGNAPKNACIIHKRSEVGIPPTWR